MCVYCIYTCTSLQYIISQVKIGSKIGGDGNGKVGGEVVVAEMEG